jgi:hypothetical protein
MNNKNILFYSNSCSTCKSLIKLLENEKLIQYFLPMCVDGKLEQLPPQIEVVPTMIVKNMNKPLVAEETFEYIKQVKFIKSSQNKFDNNKGLMGFSNIELNSSSDIFAFTKPDIPALPQSYFNYKDEDKNTIFTAPEQQTIKDNDQSKLISELMSKREKQDEDYAGIAKKKRINDVIKNEQDKLLEQYKQEQPQQNQQNQQQNQQNQQQNMQSQMNQMQHMKQMQMMYNMMNNNTFGNK